MDPRPETGRPPSLDSITVKDEPTEAALVDSQAVTHRHANGLEDQTAYLPTRQLIIVFLALTAAVFLSFLDQTIVSTSLPSIAASFDAGKSSSWIASSYLLAQTAVLPIWGRLSDIWGRKSCLLSCVAIFGISSIGCALAPSLEALIAFRALQGVGGGGLLVLVLIIISDIVSLRERGRYQGIMEAVIAISNGIGPCLGGVISEKSSWRIIFWINLPLSLCSFAVIYRFLPLKPVSGDVKTKLRQIDYLGSVLTIAFAVLIMLPLNWGGITFAWSSAIVIGCFVGGAAFLVLLVMWEWKGARLPIIPPTIFRHSTPNAVFYVTLTGGMAILTQLFYVPQYLQVVRGDSAITSGALVLPLLLTITLLVFITGQLIARTGRYVYSIVLGYAIWTVGLGLLSTLTTDTSTPRLIGYLVITGFGQGQTLQSTLLAAQASVDRSEMSTVTSTRNFLRTLGGTIALALAASVINTSLRQELLANGFPDALIQSVIDDPTAIWGTTASTSASAVALFSLPPESKALIISGFQRGFSTVFKIYIGLIGSNFFVALLFIKQQELSTPEEKILKARGQALADARRGKSKDVELAESDLDEKSVEDTKV